jgi:hypothetical protein
MEPENNRKRNFAFSSLYKLYTLKPGPTGFDSIAQGM